MTVKNQQESTGAPTQYSEEIDLILLCNIFWRTKWLIIGVTFVFAICSVGYALWLPDKYRSDVLLFPVEDNSNSSTGGALLGQLGGLANLAGINLGGDAATSQKVRALATLESRAFIQEFFETHELVVPFIASRPVSSGVVEIDPTIYDEENETWIRQVPPPLQQVPTPWEVHGKFMEVLTVEDDPATGLVTVSIEWYDPGQIQQWLTWLIEDLNDKMRQRDVMESMRAIEFLNEQLSNTQLIDMRNVFYNLIEQQTRTVMLADARDEYAFQTLDPAVSPDQKSSPNRRLICIIGTMLGGVIALFLSVLIHFIKSRNDA